MNHCDPLTKTSNNLKPFRKEGIMPTHSSVWMEFMSDTDL